MPFLIHNGQRFIGRFQEVAIERFPGLYNTCNRYGYTIWEVVFEGETNTRAIQVQNLRSFLFNQTRNLNLL